MAAQWGRAGAGVGPCRLAASRGPAGAPAGQTRRAAWLEAAARAGKWGDRAGGTAAWPCPTHARAGAAPDAGLKYQDIVMGKGQTPRVGFQAVVNYVALTPAGRVFDSSLDKGKPYDIR